MARQKHFSAIRLTQYRSIAAVAFVYLQRLGDVEAFIIHQDVQPVVIYG